MRSFVHTIVSLLLIVLAVWILWTALKVTFSAALAVVSGLIFLAALVFAWFAIRSISRRTGGPRAAP